LQVIDEVETALTRSFVLGERFSCFRRNLGGLGSGADDGLCWKGWSFTYALLACTILLVTIIVLVADDSSCSLSPARLL